MVGQAMMVQAEVWFVVADGGRARIVTPAAHPGGWRTVRGLESVVLHQRDTDIGRGPPGRSSESGNATRHANERREAARERGARNFIAELAEIIDAAAEDEAFSRLVLVAPAPVLHHLAAALGPEAAGKVAMSLATDLTRLPDPDLARHLGPAWLAVSRPHPR